MRALIPLLLLSNLSMAQDRIVGPSYATRSEVVAESAMVATSQPLATQVGLDMLRAGGNAIDAAIAANAALGLMEPTGNGIGGDLFALVWIEREKKLYGLNASGRAPALWTLAQMKERAGEQIPSFGPLTVTVPGCVDGWTTLHERFGKLKFEQLLAPTIDYAEKGFPVSEVIAYYWARSVQRYRDYPNFLSTYTIDGQAPAKGQRFRNPGLAQTLRTIARKGRDGFYRGSVARTIADFIEAQGGALRVEDLATQRSEWVEPISVDYRGYRVYQIGPNGQGLAALQMLKMLEGFDLAALGYGSAGYAHLLIEAKKLAFEDRARYLADPKFAKVPVAGLLDSGYLAQRRALIDRERAARVVAAGVPESRDTIYLATADADGNMVSLIQSNYRGMGSGMVPPGLGFMLQNRGEAFALDPAHPNAYAPGKRPFHTIIPGFATRNGEAWLAFGVMGGDMQPQGHVQILVNLIDFAMGLQEAGDAPRIYHTGSTESVGAVSAMADGGRVALESGYGDWSLLRALKRLGHDVVIDDGNFGGYQAILKDRNSGFYLGASESRKDGQAAGY